MPPLPTMMGSGVRCCFTSVGSQNYSCSIARWHASLRSRSKPSGTCVRVVTDYGRSSATAVASPPPMHRAAIPRFLSCCCIACARVTIRRLPVEPMGWPWAQAPPYTFTFSCGKFSACMVNIVTIAKASLISNRSTESALQPVFSNNFSMAPMGGQREFARMNGVGAVGDNASQRNARIEVALAGKDQC